jgi:hypothetical protein
MNILRSYLNASGDVIREDNIYMSRKFHTMVDGIDAPTFNRVVVTDKAHYSGYPADRVVSSITISGDYDDIETVSGNFLLASWEFGGTTVRCNMSDLPAVGDTV